MGLSLSLIKSLNQWVFLDCLSSGFPPRLWFFTFLLLFSNQEMLNKDYLNQEGKSGSLAFFFWMINYIKK